VSEHGVEAALAEIFVQVFLLAGSSVAIVWASRLSEVEAYLPAHALADVSSALFCALRVSERRSMRAAFLTSPMPYVFFSTARFTAASAAFCLFVSDDVFVFSGVDGFGSFGLLCGVFGAEADVKGVDALNMGTGTKEHATEVFFKNAASTRDGVVKHLKSDSNACQTPRSFNITASRFPSSVWRTACSMLAQKETEA
jgi:hypothetical protein